MAPALELADLVWRRATGLQQHLARHLLGEVGPEDRPRQAPALPHLTGHGRAGDLEDGLGKSGADL